MYIYNNMKKKKIFACQFLNYNLDVLIKVKFFSICGIYIFIAEKKNNIRTKDYPGWEKIYILNHRGAIKKTV